MVPASPGFKQSLLSLWCLRAQVRITPSGVTTQGTITLVGTSTTNNPSFTEVHVHSFGGQSLRVGDLVCFDVDSNCNTLQKLCGPQCGVAIWSGPSASYIHQCAPAAGLPFP
jgi:hypothetical protein